MSLPHQPVDVDFVANLVRRQGEELLRVRKELEESQKIHVLSFKALRSTEKQFDDLHMNSMHWHLRLGSMAEELAALKTENEAFLVQVEVARMNLLDDLRLISGTLTFDSEPNADGHTTAPYTSDAMSRGSEFSARSISTASVEGEDYETAVVPPSPALNPPESSPANVAFPAAESQAERETIAAADTVEPSERPQSLPENVAVQEVEGQPEGQPEGAIAAMDTVDPLRLPESWPVVGVIETTGVISASEGHTTPIIEAPPTPNDVATPLEISLQLLESSPERIIATTGAISASKGHTLPLIEALSPSDGIATPLGNDASSAETNPSESSRVGPIATTGAISASVGAAVPLVGAPSPSNRVATPQGNNHTAGSGETNTNPPNIPNIAVQASSTPRTVASPAQPVIPTVIPASSTPRTVASPVQPVIPTASSTLRTVAPLPRRVIPTVTQASSTSQTVAPPARPVTPNAVSASRSDSDEPYQLLDLASLRPVCSKLPNPAAAKAVKALCRKVFGLGQLNLLIQNDPDALLAQPHTEQKMLITVSENRGNACSTLVMFGQQWSGHIVVRSITSLTRRLFYLGKYQTGATHRITVDEYRLLPKQTKTYVLNFARMLLKEKGWTETQLVQSLTEYNGIYVGKTEMRFLEYSATIESKLREEAGKKGYK